MKSITLITAAFLSLQASGFCQNIPPDMAKELGSSGASNEIIVVLEPEPPATGKPAAEATPAKPVLVTGRPPADSALVDDNEINHPTAPPEAAPADEPAPKDPSGLVVRVETIRTGTGKIDPSKVTLHTPFPAKPLAAAPAGWRLEASDKAPPFTREVKIGENETITLSIRPHLLLPEADGAAFFAVTEPGFNASLGYEQSATVAAVLSQSIQRLGDDSKQLGSAIDQLQQLLVSLPKPIAQPPAANPATPSSKKR